MLGVSRVAMSGDRHGAARESLSAPSWGRPPRPGRTRMGQGQVGGGVPAGLARPRSDHDAEGYTTLPGRKWPHPVEGPRARDGIPIPSRSRLRPGRRGVACLGSRAWACGDARTFPPSPGSLAPVLRDDERLPGSQDVPGPAGPDGGSPGNGSDGSGSGSGGDGSGFGRGSSSIAAGLLIIAGASEAPTDTELGLSRRSSVSRQLRLWNNICLRIAGASRIKGLEGCSTPRTDRDQERRARAHFSSASSLPQCLTLK